MPVPYIRLTRQRLRTQLFEMLYGKLAAHYDLVSAMAFAGEWSQWHQVALRFADRLPIVELGCGTGQLLASLARHGITAYGIDRARTILEQARLHHGLNLVQAEAQALPFGAASVGTLLSVFPTAYILDEAVWAEARRVLVPGGRLIVLDYGWLEARDPVRLSLRLMHRLVYGRPAVLAGPPLPAPTSVLALQERSPHGFASVWIATKPVTPMSD